MGDCGGCLWPKGSIIVCHLIAVSCPEGDIWLSMLLSKHYACYSTEGGVANLRLTSRDHFVCAPIQWETTLHVTSSPRRRYIVTSSPIGWAHTLNYPWTSLQKYATFRHRFTSNPKPTNFVLIANFRVIFYSHAILKLMIHFFYSCDIITVVTCTT